MARCPFGFLLSIICSITDQSGSGELVTIYQIPHDNMPHNLIHSSTALYLHLSVMSEENGCRVNIAYKF